MVLGVGFGGQPAFAADCYGAVRENAQRRKPLEFLICDLQFVSKEQTKVL
jgi:hypothetical protein